jgi:golgi phosphoprotein 3
MPAKPKLTMYEELLLLALDDRKGTAGMDTSHLHAMGGAILAELVLLGALRIADDKKKLVDAVPGIRVDDPLLAECRDLVQAAKRRKRAVEWVQKFCGLKDLKNRVARGLVAKGVLNEAQDRVLGIFPRTVFPARDGGPEEALRERLRQAVLGDSDRIDERTLVVTVIAHATALLPKVIDKKLLKTRKARLKQLGEGTLAGSATVEAVRAMQAAAAAVLIATTTAASAAAS